MITVLSKFLFSILKLSCMKAPSVAPEDDMFNVKPMMFNKVLL